MAKASEQSSLTAHIPGMAEAMESVSDKLKAVSDRGIFKRHSGAADVIVVSYCGAGSDRWEVSNFHVHVGRDAKLGQSMQGVSVEVFVNEKKTPLVMTVDDNYRCTFEGGSLRPNAAQVKALGGLLVPGRNAVRYQLSGHRALFDIHACMFLWEHTDKIVVCDIDGTVTRSDFLGYSAHIMGYDYTHDGVTDVLNYLHEAGYKILFLTARPITAADKTRHLLQMVGATARDDKSQRIARLLGIHTSDTVLTLPPGALITTSERWIPAIALSLSSDGPQRFKTSVLHEIQDLFGNSGVFAGGFGNRSTDSGAYRATGISASRIFLVDETSQVFVGKMEGERGQYPSYADLCERLPQLFPALRKAHDSSHLSASSGLDASSRAARAVSISRIEAAFQQFGVGEDEETDTSASRRKSASGSAQVQHGGGRSVLAGREGLRCGARDRQGGPRGVVEGEDRASGVGGGSDAREHDDDCDSNGRNNGMGPVSPMRASPTPVSLSATEYLSTKGRGGTPLPPPAAKSKLGSGTSGSGAPSRGAFSPSGSRAVGTDEVAGTRTNKICFRSSAGEEEEEGSGEAVGEDEEDWM